MAKKIIRPLKGIDVDSSPSRRDDNTIYMAKNLRVNNNESSKLGEYTNIKGTNLVVENSPNYTILKTCKLNDRFVIFIKTTETDTMDIICQIKESDIPTHGNSPIILDTYYTPVSNPVGNRIIAGEFGFDINKEINVRTYYESDLVQKIYWTIDGEPLRSLNIIYSDENNPSSYSESDLDMIPSVKMKEPYISGTISGKLLSGKIFYAYKLLNNNGAESAISPVSKGYNLTTASNTDANDYEYKGVGFDVNTGKGIKLTINNIDQSFDKIKIYSIHYLDDVSLPKVSLVYDGSSSKNIVINDVGIPILNISPEEFLSSNGLLINNGQLEIKNNRLFIGNYYEELFDIDDFAIGGYWDSRSYRFKPYGNAEIWNSDLSLKISIIGDSPDYAKVPKTHDCVNKSNDINNWESTITYNYIYQDDRVTIGSSGLNVEISQIEQHFLSPDDSGELIKWYSKKINNGYDSHANPKNDTYSKIFKLEEVYRFSIQFRNSKNQYSYPKWICDYKYVYDTANYNPIQYKTSPARVEMPLYHLNVEVSNIPIDPETSRPFEYRIMYVPLDEEDRSVYWGLFHPLYKGVDNPSEYSVSILDRDKYTEEYHEVTSKNNIVANYNYLEFISPEYCLGDKKRYTKFSIFRYTNLSNMSTSYIGNYQATVNKPYDFSTYSGINKLKTVGSQIDIKYDIDIEGRIPLEGTDLFLRMTECISSSRNGYYFNPPEWWAPARGRAFGNSNKGRCQIIKPTSAITSTYGMVPMWGCSYVDNFQSRYGGTSYNARKTNGYVALTDFSSSSFQEIRGDTYVGMFEYLRQISDNSTPYIADNQAYAEDGLGIDTDVDYYGGAPEIVIFPTYSVLNLSLRSDDFFSKMYTQNGSYMIHEYAGVYSDTLGSINNDDYYMNLSGITFVQNTDLYLYNNTYSRNQNLFEYFEKQESNSATKSFKNRIIASDLKILGEDADSFLKMNPSQYIDVDGQYGSIKTLKVFNDRLYFFQEKAIGIVAVNEQATTNMEGGSSLILGSIGLLSRYDYVTINNGINNSHHVITSDNSMYIIDEIKREFLRVNQNGLEKISITKNINSLIKEYDLSDARLVYNRKYNEIQFHCKIVDGSTYYRAFIFNEIQDAFIGYFEYPFIVLDSEPIERIDTVDVLITTSDNNIQVLNDGDYNKFNESYIPSSITFLVSSSQEDNVLFNILEFILNQVDSNGIDTDFMDTIRIYNNTYDTGELDFAANVNKRFGKHRTSKLRNYTGNKERILDNHIYITMTTKDNSVGGNNRVFFRDLITSFTEYNYYG